MDSWLDLLNIVLRSVFSVAILFFLTKLMGYRQISQLSYYDYIIGISIGSISALMATDIEADIWLTVIPLVVYSLLSILLSYITIKSVKGRRFLTGVPIILIQNGVIIKRNLVKVKYDLSDLLSECRANGYFNISDISYAIMEHTGKISFLLNPMKRPCSPEDLNLSPQPEGIVVNLIIDGKIMEQHLKIIGKEEKWLQKKLQEQKISNVKEVLLATYDMNDNFVVFRQNGSQPCNFNVLE